VSLINEALKRAQADKDGTPPPPPPSFAPPLEAAPASAGRGWRRAATALVAMAFLCGGLLTWRVASTWNGSSTPAGASAEVAPPSVTDTSAAKTVENNPSNVAKTPAASIQPAAGSWAGNWLDKMVRSFAGDAADRAAQAATKSPAAAPDIARRPAAAAVTAKPLEAALNKQPAPARFDVAKYKLTGVVLGDEGGSAIINGNFYQVGDAVDGAKVVKIGAKTVQLEFEGKVHVLGQ
jgi:hypothetical protein